MKTFWIAFDGLMLVHWRKDGEETILDVVVPEIEEHKKRILIDDQKKFEVTANKYYVTLGPREKEGTTPSDLFIMSHFCLDGRKVKPSAAASVSRFSFPNLPLPDQMYGRRRFITAAKTILNTENLELLKPTLFPGFTAFCEAIVFEYEADSLQLRDPDGNVYNVEQTLLIESNLPPAHAGGHGHDHGSMTAAIANHGEPFNELLEVDDVDPVKGLTNRRQTRLRVAGLKAIECLPFPPDSIPGIPKSLLDHLDEPILDRNEFHMESTSPLDCSPNFLIDG